MGIRRKKTYTLAELISFGNYLLSELRNKSVLNDETRQMVGDWDIANWQASKKTNTNANRT